MNKKLPKNRRKMAFLTRNTTILIEPYEVVLKKAIFAENRRKSAKIGENRRKSAKIGENRRKSAKIVEIRLKSAKIG
jgi:hypothetical protein